MKTYSISYCFIFTRKKPFPIFIATANSEGLPPGIAVMAGISTAVALVSYAFGYLLR